MADIWSITPGVYGNGAAFGMLAELTQQPRPRPPLRCGFREQHDGSVQADGQHVIIGSERFEGCPMLDIGAETADSGKDRLTGLGMAPELAGQPEQPQSGVEIDISRLDRSRQSDPLRLELAVIRAELDIVAVGALLEGNRQATRRISSERSVGGSILVHPAVERKRPGVPAVRIIGTTDKRAEFAELDAEPAGAADRAKPRVAPGPVIGEKMPPELGIECTQDLADGQLLGAVDRRRKSRQKLRSTSFQSVRPPDTSSSWFSRSAVKPYST